MSDPILSAVEATTRQVADLRTELTTRLDQMVTRREHDAEVRRIDADHERTRANLATHEREAAAHFDTIAARVDESERSIKSAIESEKIQRAAEAQATARQRVIDRRWLVGTLLTVGALIIAAGQLLRGFF